MNTQEKLKSIFSIRQMFDYLSEDALMMDKFLATAQIINNQISAKDHEDEERIYDEADIVEIVYNQMDFLAKQIDVMHTEYKKLKEAVFAGRLG